MDDFPLIAFNEKQICVLLDKVFPFSRFLSIHQILWFCLSDSVCLLYFHSLCVFIALIFFLRQYILILFTQQEVTLRAGQKIRELKFANQTLKIARIVELKIPNE